MTRTTKTAPPRSSRLFTEPARPADAHTAHIDGASRGNPGPAAYAVVLCRPDGSLLKELHKYIGIRTNNEAEYYGLVAALDFAIVNGIRRLTLYSDSELLVRQMQGRYKVKHPKLRPLFEQAQRIARRLEYFSVEHVPRELNAMADELANRTLDELGRKQETRVRRQGGSVLSAMIPQQSPNTLKQEVPRVSGRVRARWSKGALHPAEPLELPEDSEVEITIHPRKT